MKVYETRHGFKDTRNQIDRVAHERVIGQDGYKKIKSSQNGQNQNDLHFKGSNRDMHRIDEDWRWHANNLNMREFKVDHSLGYNDYNSNSNTNYYKTNSNSKPNNHYQSMGYNNEPD